MRNLSRALRGLSPLLGVFGIALSAMAADPQRTWQQPTTGMDFVWVDGGCFEMGADEAGPVLPFQSPEPPHADELPRHQVCLDGFWLGRYPVTRAQWQQLMEPAVPTTDDMFPATGVSWEDVKEFVERLNSLEGGSARFRLPTEAEWEYACRAGNTSELYPERDELDHLAWYWDTIPGRPAVQPVGGKAANAWGLHDMLGNVWEWVADVYLPDGYAHHALYNPRVTEGSERRVIRGGSYRSGQLLMRCGNRNYGVPGDRLPMLGLRLVKDGGSR